MTTREKIILMLACLALIFGVYELFLAGPDSGTGHKKSESSAEIASFIQQVAKQIKQTALSTTEKYVIAHSSLAWKKNPFLASLSALGGKEAKQVESKKENLRQPRWTYSGFVSLGSKKLAIINGIEYEAGEMLLEKNYYLRKIENDHIEIVSIKDGRVTILPLKDDQP